ncbi:Uma2 family endonuclease [Myxococcus sp. RHSTA-1-4]|uniref:Uma2 family endonuclease n=1 Tax=Myxococcus sp. RHSTA-1-4 TaxID=2874601 RepID=UPI001CC13455|nr:Uma2 family endonuclease [Myxococcus sp. RHSTA-1-4]MBZ4419231.1 Uma2 family endonuclease [Myxococcus sp. RHSTA-1-4]
MTPDEQARVYAALPGEVTDEEMSPPEGDRHFLPKARALDTLKGHFEREGRRVYVSCALPTYYPDEPRFAPDLLVVADVEPHARDKWVVSAEGKGLDFVLEVHAGGDRKKDAERNVARYARLRIPEYFIYDGAKLKLRGYRLPGPKARKYVSIKPVKGRFPSKRLGLELQVEGDRLRFYENGVRLLESAEQINEMLKLIGELQHLGSARKRAGAAKRRPGSAKKPSAN